MLLSAIVPTRDRPLALRRCLESLQAQAIDASRLEVLVVDDGGRAEVGALVQSIAARGPVGMRALRQPPSGLNSARNLGMSAAAGEALAFLDDDTIVTPDWAAAMLGAFQATSCDAVGGRVELLLEGPAPTWLSERSYYLAEYDLGPQPRWIEGEDFVPVGANCAIRRAVLERIGGFHRGLDRIGSSLISNGDTELFRRLQSQGGTLRYEPAAKVMHCVPAERLTVEFFVKRHYAQGVSDELLLTIQGHQPGRWRQLETVRKLKTERGALAMVAFKNLVRLRGTTMARFELAYWAGHLAGARMQVPAGILPSPRGPYPDRASELG